MQELLDAAISCGATNATIINQSQIVLSEEFRKICESNQCGGFGKCWMCPPYLPDVQSLMREVRTYSSALWFQTITEIEDSYDIEGMFEAGAAHARVSVKVKEAVATLLHEPILLLSCGGCHLCETCSVQDNQPCRFPDKALSSLEGYGVDVYRTTKDTELKYINGQNTVTYFGMVLFTE